MTHAQHQRATRLAAALVLTLAAACIVLAVAGGLAWAAVTA